MKLLILICSFFISSQILAGPSDQANKLIAEEKAKVEKCDAEMVIVCKNISRSVCLETKTFSDNCNSILKSVSNFEGMMGGCEVKMSDYCKIEDMTKGGPSFEVRMKNYEDCKVENKSKILSSCPDFGKNIEKLKNKQP